MGLFVVVVTVAALSRVVVVEATVLLVVRAEPSALLITIVFCEKGVNAPVEETREVRINRVCFMIAAVVLWEIFFMTLPIRMWVCC